MSTERAFYPDESFKANSDLSAKQFYIVKLTAADVVDLTSGTTDLPIGVLQNAPKINEAAQVRVGVGISRVISDGSGTAIAVGDRVGTDASGRAVKKASANDLLLGIALEASTAANVEISVLLVPPGTQRSN